MTTRFNDVFLYSFCTLLKTVQKTASIANYNKLLRTNMSEFDDIERTLCQLPQVHVFKIPVRKTAGKNITLSF